MLDLCVHVRVIKSYFFYEYTFLIDNDLLACIWVWFRGFLVQHTIKHNNQVVSNILIIDSLHVHIKICFTFLLFKVHLPWSIDTIYFIGFYTSSYIMFCSIISFTFLCCVETFFYFSILWANHKLCKTTFIVFIGRYQDISPVCLWIRFYFYTWKKVYYRTFICVKCWNTTA